MGPVLKQYIVCVDLVYMLHVGQLSYQNWYFVFVLLFLSLSQDLLRTRQWIIVHTIRQSINCLNCVFLYFIEWFSSYYNCQYVCGTISKQRITCHDLLIIISLSLESILANDFIDSSKIKVLLSLSFELIARTLEIALREIRECNWDLVINLLS